MDIVGLFNNEAIHSPGILVNIIGNVVKQIPDIEYVRLYLI